MENVEFKNEYGEIILSTLEDLKTHVSYKVDVYYTLGKKDRVGYIPIIDNYFQYKKEADVEMVVNRIMSYFIHEFCDKGRTLLNTLNKLNANAEKKAIKYLKRPENLEDMTKLNRVENYVCF